MQLMSMVPDMTGKPCQHLQYGVSNLFYGKGPHWSLWAGLQATCGKITKTGKPNCLNSCQIFTVYKQFTNVAMGHILQSGRP